MLHLEREELFCKHNYMRERKEERLTCEVVVESERLVHLNKLLADGSVDCDLLAQSLQLLLRHHPHVHHSSSIAITVIIVLILLLLLFLPFHQVHHLSLSLFCSVLFCSVLLLLEFRIQNVWLFL